MGGAPDRIQFIARWMADIPGTPAYSHELLKTSMTSPTNNTADLELSRNLGPVHIYPPDVPVPLS